MGWRKPIDLLREASLEEAALNLLRLRLQVEVGREVLLESETISVPIFNHQGLLLCAPQVSFVTFFSFVCPHPVLCNPIPHALEMSDCFIAPLGEGREVLEGLKTNSPPTQQPSLAHTVHGWCHCHLRWGSRDGRSCDEGLAEWLYESHHPPELTAVSPPMAHKPASSFLPREDLCNRPDSQEPGTALIRDFYNKFSLTLQSKAKVSELWRRVHCEACTC